MLLVEVPNDLAVWWAWEWERLCLEGKVDVETAVRIAPAMDSMYSQLTYDEVNGAFEPCSGAP